MDDRLSQSWETTIYVYMWTIALLSVIPSVFRTFGLHGVLSTRHRYITRHRGNGRRKRRAHIEGVSTRRHNYYSVAETLEMIHRRTASSSIVENRNPEANDSGMTNTGEQRIHTWGRYVKDMGEDIT